MSSNFILESFWQRGANCACVAYIKALLLQYGIKAGFKVKEAKKGVQVQLPDGVLLSFTRQEIYGLNKNNEISFRRYHQPEKKIKSKKIKFTVQLLFAVLVKNMQVKGYRSRKPGTEEAISILTKQGVQTGHFHRYLGSKRGKAHRLTKETLSYIKKKKSVILYNDKHIVAASKGHYDNNGHAELIEQEIPLLLGDKATRWCEIT